VYQEDTTNAFEVDSYGAVTNTGSSTITLQIDIVLVNNSYWFSDTIVGICDWHLCHAPGYFHYSIDCPPGTDTIHMYASIVAPHKSFYGVARVTLTSGSTSHSQDFGMSTYPVGIKPMSTIVSDFKLNQNYPNPFNPSTKIGFSIPKNSLVDLRVYDILGREAAVIMSGFVNAGEYEVEFDARNLASGIYYYRFKTPDYVNVKKMTLVK